MGNKKIVLIILSFLASFSLILTGVAMADSQFRIRDFEDLRENLKNEISQKFIQDEIIVKFKGDKEPFRVIKIPAGKVSEEITKYRNRGDVIYAEPNHIAYALMVPNDPYYKYQWHLDNPVYGGIQMEEAWDISMGSSSVVVAVVDTGIAYENYGKYCKAPDLAQTCFVSGYDYINNDSHPNDDNSHGTHVAGTIAQSTNNSTGVAGIAFNSCLMPVKVLNSAGSGSYAAVASGIRYAADNGAKVINLSLGGSASDNTLKDAVKYAYEKGVTVIAACGNENANGCLYPAAYDDYVIAVGATQYNETKAPYSNYGINLDIVAPGGNTSVDQNGDGYVDGVLQQTFKSSYYVCTFAYYFYQGTSMATPHTAGVAALLITKGNATTPNQVRAALQETAEDKGTPGRDNTYGYGIVDAYKALQWGAGPACSIDADCDDGLYCNGAEACVAGTCKTGTAVECSALSNQCNDGVCDETLDSCVAQPKPNGTSCDDGLYCNVGETCQAGACTGGSARSCDDGKTCTTDSCNEDLDKCENTWPACDLLVKDACCGPECDSTNDSDCPSAVKCWSGGYQYLYRNNSQAKKFCKCASGIYGYSSYSYTWSRKIVYQYVDSGDNENWGVVSASSYLPVYQVTCTNGVAYPTNKDYYFPK
jgi:serine protease